MFHQFDEWGPWSRGNRKSFQLGFVRQNLSSSIDILKLQTLVPFFRSWMCDCVALAVDYETVMHQVMNNWNRKIFLVIDGERQRLRNISISVCMRVCVLIYESLVASTRIVVDACGVWRFGHLWRLACCSSNTFAKAQQSIVMSPCLHVHLSRKRQRGVYRSPLNLVWHYKHVSVSAYTWRHKLGNYIWLNYRDWQHIYQKADGTNAKRERCRRL